MAPEASSIAANGGDAKERGGYHLHCTGGAHHAPEEFISFWRDSTAMKRRTYPQPRQISC